jgi:dTMP kinase
MRIAALEGPSFAGKTSTLAALRSLLPTDGLVTFGCYVGQIDNLDDVPPARTGSAREQLDAFRLFMRIEAGRVAELNDRAGSADLVLLDRSVDTLLAHAYALDRLFGYGVYEEACGLLARLAHLRPDRTFYLDASPQVLKRRRERLTEPFDSFLLDSDFLECFRDYFIRKGLAVAAQVSIVSAEQSVSTVARTIVQTLVW